MLSAHSRPLPQAVLAHGHEFQVAGADTPRGAAKVIPLHAVAGLAHEEMVGADFHLAARVVDGPVPATPVQYVAGPKPTGGSFVHQRPEPVLNRHIVRATVPLRRERSMPPAPLVVHVAKRAMRVGVSVERPGASGDTTNGNRLCRSHAA